MPAARSISWRRNVREFERLMLVAAAACLGGCAIEALKVENAASEQRIASKSAELGSLDQRQRELKAQRDRLKLELQGHEMDAEQLLTRIESMRRFNEASGASNAAARERKSQMAQSLQKAADDARAVNQANETAERAAQSRSREDQLAAEKAKKQRLQALNDRTRKMLDLLVAN